MLLLPLRSALLRSYRALRNAFHALFSLINATRTSIQALRTPSSKPEAVLQSVPVAHTMCKARGSAWTAVPLAFTLWTRPAGSPVQLGHSQTRPQQHATPVQTPAIPAPPLTAVLCANQASSSNPKASAVPPPPWNNHPSRTFLRSSL